MTESETNPEDKNDALTPKNESAEEAASADSAPKPDEGSSEPTAEAGETQTPAPPESIEPALESVGDDKTNEPRSEGTNEPKQAVFPPIDPAAGSAATAAEGKGCGENVSQYGINSEMQKLLTVLRKPKRNQMPQNLIPPNVLKITQQQVQTRYQPHLLKHHQMKPQTLPQTKLRQRKRIHLLRLQIRLHQRLTL